MGTLKTWAILIAATHAILAPAQDSSLQWTGRTYTLGPARMISSPVEDAIWAPDGEDIAYIVRTERATQVGVFHLKRGKGFIVATLGPTEKLEQTVWLNAGHKLLLVTRRPVEERQDPTDLVTIQVADAVELRSEALWAKEIATAENAVIEINPSPSLSHALVTVKTTKTETYFVVTESAKSLVVSTDIADAIKGGHEMEGWSVYGTAMFSDDAQRNLSAETDGVFRVEPILARLYEAETGRRQSSPLGEYALEVVPSNGVLRQVRFPGFFQPAPPKGEWLRAYFQPVTLTLGQTASAVRSLWLILSKESKSPSQGLLVSAQADGGWMSPSGQSVAYTCHHTLFIGNVEAKR